MVFIRKALESDRDVISRILKELDLEYPGLTLEYFWAADLHGTVVGVARMEEFCEFCFLSALGITTAKQGHGIAAKLLQSLLEECNKDVYLYTVIPGFFKKYGFEPAALQSGLPARESFSCETCEPEKCVCMRWVSRK